MDVDSGLSVSKVCALSMLPRCFQMHLIRDQLYILFYREILEIWRDEKKRKENFSHICFKYQGTGSPQLLHLLLSSDSLPCDHFLSLPKKQPRLISSKLDTMSGIPPCDDYFWKNQMEFSHFHPVSVSFTVCRLDPTHTGVFWGTRVLSWYVPAPASGHIGWLFLK